jgi:hypothetical protein
VQGFFHSWVAELEPLLHEIDAQQGLYRKRLLAPAPGLRVHRAYQRDQFSPRRHQFHGVKEFTLACSLGGVAQAQAALLHVLVVSASSLRQHITQGFVQRVPRCFEYLAHPIMTATQWSPYKYQNLQMALRLYHVKKTMWPHTLCTRICIVRFFLSVL